jgi:hypothetical protein
LFQQDHIAHPQLGEVIGSGGANYPAPHNHDAGMGWQIGHSEGFLSVLKTLGEACLLEKMIYGSDPSYFTMV